MSGSESGGAAAEAITGDHNNSLPNPTLPISPPPPPATAPLLLPDLSFSHSPPVHIPSGPIAFPFPPSAPPAPAPAPAPAPPPLPHNLLNLSSRLNPLKRRRGRPRKYGSAIPMPLLLPPPHTLHHPPSVVPAAAPPPPSATPSSFTASLGSAGVGLFPHALTVKPGEDVCAKIMSFSQRGPQAICILSAIGAISNVTLRQTATSSGTETYEGRFDILGLSGSFLPSEVGGQRSRTGGLSISLAGPDGRILGGCVAGLLTAASPVQLIVGSFMANGAK